MESNAEDVVVPQAAVRPTASSRTN